MIAQIWRSEPRFEHTYGCTSGRRETGVRECQATEGDSGSWVITRACGEHTEPLVLPIRDSPESIEYFAGSEFNRSNVPRETRRSPSFPATLNTIRRAMAEAGASDEDW
ncbi:MAG TPA: hypothetical protein DGG94_12695 [Micromonosporaceae bacterium]|nr:hypothetical protein [Micromonosporaceae bacterium]HCU50637.1 hypothetical protein [Micromonosporaceae bacterium]